MKPRFFVIGLVLSLLIFQISCSSDETSTVEAPHLIPIPTESNFTSGEFVLKENTAIHLASDDADLQKVGQYLSGFLQPATGFKFEVKTEEASTLSHFLLELKEEKALGDEGYQLNISSNQVHLTAHKAAGLFRGVQTIRQLLPATIEAREQQNETFKIPVNGSVKDVPAYGYRGAMLDIARHFFGVEDIKKYIDYVAMYKMNTLHLHLTDDQGWRIEIKSWPKLATYGGQTEVGGGEGGYLTQEEYTEIINYAADRFIKVIPEIDMPGHTNAALAAYPELYCTGKKPELYTGIEVGFSTLCAQNEKTYEFVDDVIKEIAALTPGKYIHIGGDESNVTEKADYIEFVEKVQAIVNKYDKTMIGWDEVATSKLDKSSISQLWHSPKNAKLAVEQGMKLILSPANKAYMDMKYDSTTQLGLHWAGYIEVDTGYIWSPESVIDGVSNESILGVEAPLWSETVETMDDIEYMIFPRILGYSEIGWSPKEKRNWDDYKVRLASQAERFEIMDINFYKSPKVWDEHKN